MEESGGQTTNIKAAPTTKAIGQENDFYKANRSKSAGVFLWVWGEGAASTAVAFACCRRYTNIFFGRAGWYPFPVLTLLWCMANSSMECSWIIIWSIWILLLSLDLPLSPFHSHSSLSFSWSSLYLCTSLVDRVMIIIIVTYVLLLLLLLLLLLYEQRRWSTYGNGQCCVWADSAECSDRPFAALFRSCRRTLIN